MPPSPKTENTTATQMNATTTNPYKRERMTWREILAYREHSVSATRENHFQDDEPKHEVDGKPGVRSKRYPGCSNTQNGIGIEQSLTFVSR